MKPLKKGELVFTNVLLLILGLFLFWVFSPASAYDIIFIPIFLPIFAIGSLVVYVLIVIKSSETGFNFFDSAQKKLFILASILFVIDFIAVFYLIFRHIFSSFI